MSATDTSVSQSGKSGGDAVAFGGASAGAGGGFGGGAGSGFASGTGAFAAGAGLGELGAMREPGRWAPQAPVVAMCRTRRPSVPSPSIRDAPRGDRHGATSLLPDGGGEDFCLTFARVGVFLTNDLRERGKKYVEAPAVLVPPLEKGGAGAYPREHGCFWTPLKDADDKSGSFCQSGQCTKC
ncbi:MAG: hypothetical protein FD149_1416 [Rhodospirillaceae bacterium]|nr:MAG: hypothetical protein FD149_1416 [Rhodospirillaceae bacterium]